MAAAAKKDIELDSDEEEEDDGSVAPVRRGSRRRPAKRSRDEEEEEEEEEDEDNDSDDNDDDDGDDDDNDDDDDDDEDNEDDDEEADEDADADFAEAAPKRSKRSSSRASSKASSRSASKPRAKASPKAPRARKAAVPSSRRTTGKVKALKPIQRVERAMKAFKWWEAPARPAGVKWTSLEHAGVVFAPEYEPHGVPVLYEGKPVALTPPQEEAATFFAMCHNAQQLQTEDSARTFKKNFFADWRPLLGPGHVIQGMDGVDFQPIVDHIAAKRETRLAMTKEEKEAAKAVKDASALKHGFALVDGHVERMGNFNIEPPSLFRGRGQHPKMGSIKARIMPEDIMLNCGYDAVVPACPIPGRAWSRVVSDPAVTWAAGWHQNVMDDNKYVYLAASSSFKGESDRSKYEKARKLKSFIDRIRAHYTAALRSKDPLDRQVGTAMWVIDRLALRVGGEKEDDEADTFGCCSLLVSHFTFVEDVAASDVEAAKEFLEDLAAKRGRGELTIGEDEEEMSAASAAARGVSLGVTMDFPGKDSMRYYQTIDMGQYGEVGERVYQNLRRLAKGKKGGEQVFDLLSPTVLNSKLKELMPGLSAKVFRTYNASITLEQELPALDAGLSIDEKVLEYNRANREVAILCNHQRSVGKGFAEAITKMQTDLELLESQVLDLARWAKAAKAGKDIPVKDAGRACHQGKASDLSDELKAERAAERHLFARQPAAAKVTERLAAYRSRVQKQKLKLRNKDDNKAVALNTSKINYMDPRITVAWCKRVELPIEKVFARTLQDKFPWAMGESMRFAF